MPVVVFCLDLPLLGGLRQRNYFAEVAEKFILQVVAGQGKADRSLKESGFRAAVEALTFKLEPVHLTTFCNLLRDEL